MQSVDDKGVFVFVGDANPHHSEWLESLSPTHQHECDTLDFCNLSCCELLVRCPTHITGNRLDLLMTDVPIIAEVGVLHRALQITSSSIVCFLLNNLCQSTMSEVLCF